MCIALWLYGERNKKSVACYIRAFKLFFFSSKTIHGKTENRISFPGGKPSSQKFKTAQAYCKGQDQSKCWCTYLVHLHVQVGHCQTLRAVSTFTGQNESTVFDWWKHGLVLSRVVKMTVKTSKKWPCVHIWVNGPNRQLTDFDLYSYLPLKCSYSRRDVTCIITYL